MKEKRPIIALSGGFDPPRKNHIAMILDASQIGDVVIILNSNEWCSHHHWNGKFFSDYESRKGVLGHIPGVVDVIPADDADGTVCSTLRGLMPDYFGNGGSRDMTNTPEVQLCKELGIGMMWYLGDTTDEKTLQKAETYLTIAINKVYHND